MIRVGYGYDVHRLVEGRKLMLGGVDIPFEKGLLGHSDADVLLHAITDALFGAAALGDIGSHFPDTDPRYKGADSLKLLEACGREDLAKEMGLRYARTLRDNGMYHIINALDGSGERGLTAFGEKQLFWSAWASSGYLFFADRYGK